MAGRTFASSLSTLETVWWDTPQARDMLIVAQDQHWQVLDAIGNREGARADAIMREHSRLAQRNLRDAMQAPGKHAVPGVRLIKK